MAAVLLVVVDRTLMAWRWLWLLVPFAPAVADDGSRPRVGLGAILHVFFVSTFVGTFLPASVGGDAVRAAALARLGVPMADAVASVFMDRVLGVLGVLAMAVVRPVAGARSAGPARRSLAALAGDRGRLRRGGRGGVQRAGRGRS